LKLKYKVLQTINIIVLITANFSYFIILDPSEFLASEAVALTFGAKISTGKI
jgi:hypothetical protein